jgi:hypothetical protein
MGFFFLSNNNNNKIIIMTSVFVRLLRPPSTPAVAGSRLFVIIIRSAMRVGSFFLIHVSPLSLPHSPTLPVENNVVVDNVFLVQ